MDPPSVVATFKERHPEFQHFARELKVLLDHNRRVFGGDTAMPVRSLPQLALGFVALERFLRILPGLDATADDTLPNLLERASGKRLGLIQIDDRVAAIRRINCERRTFMHGRLRLSTTGRHAAVERARFVDDLTIFIDQLLLHVDVGSGVRRSKARPIRLDTTRREVPNAAVFLSPEEELEQLRSHNKAVAETDDHSELLHLAEGALTLALFERACRLVAGGRVREDDKFRVVLERTLLADDAPVRLLVHDPPDAVERIVRARNTLVHANYEQVAAELALPDIADYFRSSQYISEVEALHGLYQDLRRALAERRGRARRRWRRG